MNEVVLHTNLPLPKQTSRTKDIYNLGENLLIVTTDRFNESSGIADKGNLNNKLSDYWFNQLYDIETHYITGDVFQMTHFLAKNVSSEIKKENYRHRTMLVKKLKPLPVEIYVQGFLTGKAWETYEKDGRVCDCKLPKGMKKNMPLPEPIVLIQSHKKIQEISLDQMIDDFEKAGFNENFCMEVVEKSIEIYKQAAIMAFNAGLIIASTKLKWASANKKIAPVLIGEILTPDTTNYWDMEEYELGKDIDCDAEKYQNVFAKITGQSLSNL